jgi:hypothetical protein
MHFILLILFRQRVETMSDGSAFHACALSWGRDLALLSAGSAAETDDLQQLVTAWARFYCGGATESPRGSPRRGQLRGYLLRVTRGPPERVWASQVSGDTLSLYPVRGKEPVACIDMVACTRCSFDRVLLQFVLHENDRQHVFRCESEESYVYWRSAVLKYAHERRPPPVTQTIDLNYTGNTSN